MAGLKKQRRIQLIVVGMGLLIAAAVLIGIGFNQAIELFRAPSQVVADAPPASEKFRLGGLVEDGSLVRGEGDRVLFTVTDGSEDISVSYAGILPDLFREGQGVVATGYLRDGLFVADEILAKHDENYMPREVADALKEQGVYKGE